MQQGVDKGRQHLASCRFGWVGSELRSHTDSGVGAVNPTAAGGFMDKAAQGSKQMQGMEMRMDTTTMSGDLGGAAIFEPHEEEREIIEAQCGVGQRELMTAGADRHWALALNPKQQIDGMNGGTVNNGIEPGTGAPAVDQLGGATPTIVGFQVIKRAKGTGLRLCAKGGEQRAGTQAKIGRQPGPGMCRKLLPDAYGLGFRQADRFFHENMFARHEGGGDLIEVGLVIGGNADQIQRFVRHQLGVQRGALGLRVSLADVPQSLWVKIT